MDDESKLYIYIYIYIDRQREKERERGGEIQQGWESKSYGIK